MLSFTVLLILTVVALSAGHLLGGPAFGDRVALAMTSAKQCTMCEGDLSGSCLYTLFLLDCPKPVVEYC
jgi:hypothetical protein